MRLMLKLIIFSPFSWIYLGLFYIMLCAHAKNTAAMASLPHGNPTSCSLVCEKGPISFAGISSLPSIQMRARAFDGLVRGQ